MKKLLKSILFQPRIAGKITKFLLLTHKFSYKHLGAFARVAEGGLHPKHRLINYHQFFVDNVQEGEDVLDVGCGNGALLEDIAKKTKGNVIGVEIVKANALEAEKRLAGKNNVSIVHQDIWKYDGTGHFDTVLISNCLEHLDRRPEILRMLKDRFGPDKILIRVPMFERDWTIPFKKEKGIDWRLDVTHETEYTEDELKSELTAAGLEIRDMNIRWGEFYVVAVPAKEAVKNNPKPKSYMQAV